MDTHTEHKPTFTVCNPSGRVLGTFSTRVDAERFIYEYEDTLPFHVVEVAA